MVLNQGVEKQSRILITTLVVIELVLPLTLAIADPWDVGVNFPTAATASAVRVILAAIIIFSLTGFWRGRSISSWIIFSVLILFSIVFLIVTMVLIAGIFTDNGMVNENMFAGAASITGLIAFANFGCLKKFATSFSGTLSQLRDNG